MFGTQPIEHVTVQVLSTDARAAALALAESGVFLPEGSSELDEKLPDDPARDQRERLASAETRLEKLLTHYSLPAPAAIESMLPVGADELEVLDEWLGELWGEASQMQERMRHLQEEEKRVESLLVTLENFHSLDIDLGMLQRDMRFLDLRLGTVPAVNVSRLTEAANLAGYMVIGLMTRGGLTQVAVAGPKGNEQALSGVLRAAGWHDLQIPEEFKSKPESVAAELGEQHEALQVELARLQAEISRRGRELEPRLHRAAQVVARAAPFGEIGEGMRSRGELTAICGWVPRNDIAHLQYRLRRRIAAPVVVSSRRPRPDERVPSVIRHPTWLRPFASLVKNFGTPRYGEFDPTWLFAITYVAMFGMMFGDIGHGLVIAGLGLAFRKKLHGFAPFAVAAGLSSTGFGFLYGSLFGFEHLIHPIWISPMSDPVLMLTVALYWGIAFLGVALLINIYNHLTARHWMEALFDGKGVAGLVLYGALISAVWQWMLGDGVSAFTATLVILSLLLILGYYWQHSDRPMGERFITVAIEGFEVLMGFLSGTLSFLRVAAFSLNHVALATAIFALASMMDTTGHWITVVLGNIFIIVLEGAIVGIQTMRLEYYEGFSRFFSGDGREFKPLRLKLQPKGNV